MSTTRRALLAALACIFTVACALPAGAQSPTRIRFVLDWKYQSTHSFIIWAKEKGYFAKEGLDVTIDQGEGSAATVTRIVSGAYDAGLGDVNAIIQVLGKGDENAPVMTYMLYNSAPFALISKKSGPVQKLADIAGRRLGVPAGASAGTLFPVLAQANNIDAGAIQVVNMQPSLQEQMMLRGQVDFAAVFTVTSYANLIAQGVDPDKDINWLLYSDHGVPLYSNGVMVSRKLAKESPKAVAGLTRALNKALIEVADNPDEAIKVFVAMEPLLDARLEKLRLLYALRTHIVTAETDKLGVGAIDPAHMARAIDVMVKAYSLPKTPAVDQVFDASFLPPIEERKLSLK